MDPVEGLEARVASIEAAADFDQAIVGKLMNELNALEAAERRASRTTIRIDQLRGRTVKVMNAGTSTLENFPHPETSGGRMLGIDSRQVQLLSLSSPALSPRSSFPASAAPPSPTMESRRAAPAASSVNAMTGNARLSSGVHSCLRPSRMRFSHAVFHLNVVLPRP